MKSILFVSFRNLIHLWKPFCLFSQKE